MVSRWREITQHHACFDRRDCNQLSIHDSGHVHVRYQNRNYLLSNSLSIYVQYIHIISIFKITRTKLFIES